MEIRNLERKLKYAETNHFLKNIEFKQKEIID
jgi:hypothetical protein